MTQCGDGLEAGTEKWDDGNTGNGDGCKADCSTVEAGWVCSGGSTTTADVCIKCANGYIQDNATNPQNWVTSCGDGLKAGAEKWDDGNIIGGDGCAADCSTVEAGWVCSGGSPTSIDSCTKWPNGYYQNNAANPTAWVTLWGDGFEAGTEKWDDGNTVNNDGWLSDWSAVESGWVCKLGSPTSTDIWEKWSAGFLQDNPTNPENWVTSWGDGLRVGQEIWDDFNILSGDGCSSDCLAIDKGWICIGGSNITKDSCEKCSMNYITTTNQRKCVPRSISNRASSLAYFYVIVSVVGMVFNILLIIYFSHSYVSLFFCNFSISDVGSSSYFWE